MMKGEVKTSQGGGGGLIYDEANTLGMAGGLRDVDGFPC